MIKKLIITSQLLLFISIYTYGQSDTTVCIDFNHDLNHKTRKNIIGVNASLGISNLLPFGLAYEHILKENKTIKLSVGGIPDWSFNCNIAYRSYFSNVKYAKTIYKEDKYFVQKQYKIMSAPEGLYVEATGVFSKQNYSGFQINRLFGIGAGLGYQFIFFNRIALNTSLQLPISYNGMFYYYSQGSAKDEREAVFYTIRPRVLMNLSFGIAF